MGVPGGLHVALGPGSQGDLAAPSPRAKPHVRGGEVFWRGLGAVWSHPGPGGICQLRQPDSIKTACLHNVLSVRFTAWLPPAVQYMLTLTDAVNQPLGFRLDAAQRTMCAIMPRVMCFFSPRFPWFMHFHFHVEKYANPPPFFFCTCTLSMQRWRTCLL